jgi:cholesterol transport system auxiliary component
LQPPTVVPADLRLDVELVRLQHDFTVKPSRVELSLRLQLSDLRTQQVVAVKVIEESEAAASADPYGGVQAANRALSRALTEAAAFCAAAGGGS